MVRRLDAWLTPRLFAAIEGLAAIIGSTVAVCIGKLDAATYIALVSSIGGVGVGVGIHAEGIYRGSTLNGNGGTK